MTIPTVSVPIALLYARVPDRRGAEAEWIAESCAVTVLEIADLDLMIELITREPALFAQAVIDLEDLPDPDVTLPALVTLLFTTPLAVPTLLVLPGPAA